VPSGRSRIRGADFSRKRAVWTLKSVLKTPRTGAMSVTGRVAQKVRGRKNGFDSLILAKPTAGKGGRRSTYIPRREILKKTFGIDIVCPGCQGELRPIALVRTEAVIKKILAAMGLPAEGPKVASPPPPEADGGGDATRAESGWSN
jgi:hypothetical protein